MPDDVSPSEILPLTPAVFEILLSVAEAERHGYAIMRDVEARTSGAMSLHAGTLYRALARMAEDGLIEETDEPPAGASEDERRRYYRITPWGRRVAAAESERLARQLREAVARRLYQGGEVC